MELEAPNLFHHDNAPVHIANSMKILLAMEFKNLSGMTSTPLNTLWIIWKVGCIPGPLA